jgi:hypothetical protein
MTLRSASRIAWACAAAIALGAAALRFLPGAYTIDDAFITHRMARNLAEGHGLVFNAGERLLSTTTPAYALLVAGLTKAGMEPVSAGLALNAAAAFLTCLILVLAGRGLCGGYAPGLAAAALFAIVPSSVVYSLSGMETPVYALAMCAAVCAAASRRFAVACLLAGILPWIRPDGLVTSGLVVAQVAWLRRRWFPVEFLLGLAAFAAFAIPLALYYGSPIPHSLTMKVEFFSTQFNAGFWGFVRQWVYHYYALFWDDPITSDRIRATRYLLILAGSAPFALGHLAAVWHAVRRQPAYLAFLAASPALAAAFCVGGAGIPWPWYFVSTDPLFIAGAVFGIHLAVNHSVWPGRLLTTGGRIPATLAVALLAAGLVTLRAADSYTLRPVPLPTAMRDHYMPWREPVYREAALFLNSADAADTNLVLCMEVGAIGYYSRFKVWDGLLTTPRKAAAGSHTDIVRRERPLFLTFLGMYAMNPALSELPERWDVPEGGPSYKKIFDRTAPGEEGPRHRTVVYRRED